MLALISSIIASIQLNLAIIDIQDNYKKKKTSLSKRRFNVLKSRFHNFTHLEANIVSPGNS